MRPGSDRIVYSKIGVPMRRNVVIDRIRLRRGLGVPLTVVYAPPGYGKTTFALQRAEALTKNITWLSLDALDNDPARFWQHMAEALRNILAADIIEALHLTFVQAGADGAEHAVDILLNALADEKTASTVLVIDDFHHVNNAGILRDFNRFLDFLPRGLQLIISSRSPPDLRLSSRRINAAVSIFNLEDLRFTDDEVQVLLAQQGLAERTADSLQPLLNKADGWIAALQLLFIAARECHDRFSQVLAPPRIAQAFHKGVYALLVDEVFNAQTEPMQQALMALAISPRFSIALADMLIESSEAGQLIKALLDRNLFIASIDAKDQWFKFHDLFRLAVLERFSRLHPDYRKWHLKAGRWFEQHGFVFDALDHFVEAQSWENVVALLTAASAQLERERQDVNFRRILARVPAGTLQEYPEIVMAYVLVMKAEEKRIYAPALLEAAIARVQEMPTTLTRSRILCMLLSLQIYVAHMRFAWQESMNAAKIAFPIAENAMPALAWPACFALGHESLMHGEWLAAEGIFARGLRHIDKSAYPKSLVILTLYYAITLVRRNAHKQAGQLVSYVERYMNDSALVYAPRAGVLAIVSIMLALERLDMSALSKHLQQLNAFEALGVHDSLQAGWIAWCRYIVAIVKANKEEAETALDQLESVMTVTGMSHFYGLGSIPALRARLAWCFGSRDVAQQWLGAHESILQDSSPSLLADQLVAARILIGVRQSAKALTLLEHVEQLSQRTGADMFVYECRLLQVLALDVANRKQDACSRLTELLQQTSQQRLMRLYLEESEAIAPLIELLPEKILQDRYVKQISSAFKRDPRHGECTVLSRKERDVLLRVGQGLSTKEIARELAISPGTVKTHLRNTYRKLQVNGHIQALTKFTNLNEMIN